MDEREISKEQCKKRDVLPTSFLPTSFLPYYCSFLFSMGHILYAFKAQNDTELSFGKGDRLEVLDRPSSDPEWFKVRNLRLLPIVIAM